MGFWENREVPESLYARYVRNNSPIWISNFVAQGFVNGTTVEDFLIYLYECITRYTPSGADLNVHGKLAEAKSTSIHADGHGKWQHIEPAHEWDFLLLVRVEYESIEIYLMCRKDFEKAQLDGAARIQGQDGVSYEGWWFDPYTKALPYTKHVASITGPNSEPNEDDGDCVALKKLIDNCTEGINH